MGVGPCLGELLTRRTPREEVGAQTLGEMRSDGVEDPGKKGLVPSTGEKKCSTVSHNRNTV